MWKQLISGIVTKTSQTDFRFDYFGQGVEWRIVQTQTDNDFTFVILCDHVLFNKFFPTGEAKITGLFYRSKDAQLERSERVFFQNMIDSCDIV